jgi:hypothetical protein
VLSWPSALLRPPDSLSAAHHFPCGGYRQASFPGPAARGGGGISSSHDHHLTVPRPYAEGFLSTRSRLPGAVHGLHRLPIGSAPSWSRSRGWQMTTLQASLHAADRPVARPLAGRSTSASTPGSRPTPGVLLPGTLASPRTGLAPAGRCELVARLRRYIHLLPLPVSFSARATGRTANVRPVAFLGG